MRTALGSLELHQPDTLADALQMLHDAGAGAPLTPIAGCTDVLVGLNAGTSPTRQFLNLWGLKELRKIERRGKGLRVGALVTYTDLIRSPLVGKHLPILVEAARQVGGRQIQNRGTLGGNIANGSPAGDTLPILAAVEAVLELASAGGRRHVPFVEFYTGYRKTVLRPDELIVAVELPAPGGRAWFRKVGTRAANAISKVVFAGIRPAKGRPRIALGSVGPTVLRLPRTELVLGEGGTIDAAKQALAEEITPIDDLRSTATYRLRVAQNLLGQFWTETGR